MDKNSQEKLEQIRAIASENVELAKASVQHGAEELNKQAHDLAETAGEKLALARAHASKAADEATKIITTHPLSAIAAAAAVGALAAWALPKKARKPKNNKTASADKAARVKAAGHDVSEKVTASAKNALKEAGNLAEQAGQAARKAPGAIADTATDVAARLSEKMQDISFGKKK